MNKVIIRKAGLDDATNIAVLKQQVWISTYAVEGIRQEFSGYVLAEFTVDKVREVLLKTDLQILVAMQENHLIGCVEVSLTPTRPTATIDACPEMTVLYVLDRFGGMGIGRQLLTEALQELSGHGYNRLWLTVYHENERAINFYKKNRFMPVGEKSFEMNGNKYKNWIMLREP